MHETTEYNSVAGTICMCISERVETFITNIVWKHKQRFRHGGNNRQTITFRIPTQIVHRFSVGLS